MPDGIVSAAEANLDFAKILRNVEEGGRVTITKDGKPVAVLSPATEPDATAREKARQRMLVMLREGLPLGYTGRLDRDEIHSR